MPQLNHWSAFEPRGSTWNVALAGHLLRRTSFGFTTGQLRQALADGPAKTVERLFAVPPDYATFDRNMTALVPPEATSQDSGELWLYRMRNTPYPLLEKITFFWFDFFAVAGSRVRQPSLMQRHIALLRRHALGRFNELLDGIAHDPASLIANGPPTLLDPAAFSGVTVLRGEYHFQAARHRGDITPADAIHRALSSPAAAQAVVRRLCRWLLGAMAPNPSDLDALAAEFSRDYDIGKLASTILRSNLFFSPAAYRQDVKSPVDFALNLAIALDAPIAPAQLLPPLARLGQRLPDPPSREGWPGGRRWLNTFTIVGRSNLAAAILAKINHYPDRRTVIETLLQNDVSPGVLQDLARYDGIELAQAIANLPEFQLA